MSGQAWIWVIVGIVLVAVVLLYLSRRGGSDGADAAGGEQPAEVADRPAGQPPAAPAAGPTAADPGPDPDAAGPGPDSAASAPDGADEPEPVAAATPAATSAVPTAAEPAAAPAPVRSDDRGAATPALAALDSGLAGGGSGAPVVAAEVVAAATLRPGPHPGSALPAADGSQPSEEYAVKANDGSRRYHTADSPYYVRTRADVWFRSGSDAEAAGYAAWNGRSAAG